jgi:glycosyltransferase involved in cell wall biosynthesis
LSGPRVSVVMPARNEERYIESAVRSILGQTFADFELIAIDDGSTDATRSILLRLAEEDRRLIVNCRDGQGLVSALNAGVASAGGDYLARMDADDVSLPTRLERQVAELDRRPALGVLGTRVGYIDAEGRRVSTWNVPVGQQLVRWTLLFGTPLAHPSVVMRRELLPETPYLSTAPHAEDYDLWVRLAGSTELDNVPEILLERRVYGESVSDRNADRQRESGWQIQRRAIALRLGVEPSAAEVRALQEPRSWRELLGAAWLIWRLYRASGGGADIRRDAISRLRGGARYVLQKR